jgi:hypothetical protein
MLGLPNEEIENNVVKYRFIETSQPLDDFRRKRNGKVLPPPGRLTIQARRAKAAQRNYVRL